MRVLFLASFFPKPGNPVMGTWALGQARALARAGVELKVVSFTSWVPRWLARTPGAKAYAHCPRQHDWDGVGALYPRWLFYPVEPLRRWAYRRPRRQMELAWWSARRRLRKIVADFRPDVVYCHHSLPNGYLALRLRQKTGLPYIVTDHDFGEISDCQHHPSRRRTIELVTQHAAMMVCVARRMEQTMRRLFPAARVCTIHNGIDLPPPTTDSTPSTDRQVIFSCGMFAPRKGFPLLLEAFAQIAPKFPRAVLRIAGDGPDRPAVEAAIARTGLGDRVELLGKIAHARVFEEMARCEFFALIGGDEPFATVFIEAMGCGKAIVTASDGGINDVVEDGVHGLTVTPGDAASAAAALQKLLTDRALCRRMGVAARKLVEDKLTWDANAQRMIALFMAAARPGTAPPSARRSLAR